jgi:hypothetical protein
LKEEPKEQEEEKKQEEDVVVVTGDAVPKIFKNICCVFLNKLKILFKPFFFLFKILRICNCFSEYFSTATCRES